MPQKPKGMPMHTHVCARMLKVYVHMLHACCRRPASIGSEKLPSPCLHSTTYRGDSSRARRAPLEGLSNVWCYGCSRRALGALYLSLSVEEGRSTFGFMARIWANFKGLPKVSGVANNHWVFLKFDYSPVSS